MQATLRYLPGFSQGWYWQLGTALSTTVILGTFVGMWVYCISRFGFPVGFILGWLAAPTTAVVAGSMTMLLWSLPLVARSKS